jgi:hypothetical protein
MAEADPFIIGVVLYHSRGEVLNPDAFWCEAGKFAGYHFAETLFEKPLSFPPVIRTSYEPLDSRKIWPFFEYLIHHVGNTITVPSGRRFFCR